MEVDMRSMLDLIPRSLVQKDPLEKVMATHSNILAWRDLQTEELAGCSP